MSYLRECPFCGGGYIGISENRIDNSVTMLRCMDCGATVSFRGSEEPRETIRAWNNRVEADPWILPLFYIVYDNSVNSPL